MTCCFCGKQFEGEGHHPEPLGNVESDRCCDQCYTGLVEPMKLTKMLAELNAKYGSKFTRLK